MKYSNVYFFGPNMIRTTYNKIIKEPYLEMEEKFENTMEDYMAIGLQKDSEYRKIFNRQLSKMREQGPRVAR